MPKISRMEKPPVYSSGNCIIGTPLYAHHIFAEDFDWGISAVIGLNFTLFDECQHEYTDMVSVFNSIRNQGFQNNLSLMATGHFSSWGTYSGTFPIFNLITRNDYDGAMRIGFIYYDTRLFIDFDASGFWITDVVVKIR